MTKVRILTFAVLAALANAASAQSFELERLQLDPSAIGSLVVGTGEVNPARSFRLSAAGDWEHRPLVRHGTELFGRRTGDAIVKDRQTLHLTLDYVPVERVELYARASYVLNQDGERGLSAAKSDGFGMPSFGIRISALSQRDGASPVNVAFAGEFLPPWGTAGAFAKFSKPAALLKLELGRDLGNVIIGAEGGLVAREGEQIQNTNVGSEVIYGATIAMKGTIRPELSFRGATPFEAGPSTAEVLAGLRAVLGPAELFALGGPGFFNAIGTPEWRGVVGLAFGMEGARAKKEAAPEQAAPPPPPPPAAAAPVDPCAPGQSHTPDQCPNLDDDGDGVANKDDACPTEKGLPELKGCPAKDTDGDGVPDHQDKCPDQAGPADNQGCPRVVVQPEAKKIELREKVQFEAGKATIRPESDKLIEDIANVLKEHPEIKRVQVEGHADSSGSAALNKRLSQARADAVAKAIAARGVDKARLSAKGYGPSRPIASNDTPEGREANRRVEISIVQSE
ncbi:MULTISPECIES: OmpA family protein [unclassified Anaeromyxobacter]|uniref:OmpA family protein n=1 Tax=unclassified Anaeromyxobacter TaxID=2620896 RepID=UPI001F5A2AD6|nr:MULTISPECIES: OmpA family protein [unclassified Anaeromyxobacter]